LGDFVDEIDVIEVTKVNAVISVNVVIMAFPHKFLS